MREAGLLRLVVHVAEEGSLGAILPQQRDGVSAVDDLAVLHVVEAVLVLHSLISHFLFSSLTRIHSYQKPWVLWSPLYCSP